MPERTVEAILAVWRSLERELEAADAEERAALHAEIETIRVLYQAAVQRRARATGDGRGQAAPEPA